MKYRFLPYLLITVLAACGEKAPPPPPPAAPAPPAAAPEAKAPEAPPAAPAASAADTASAAGESIYKKTCALCHSAGVGGAPKFGSAAEWGPRVAKGKEILYKHASEGFTGEKGMMPARGGNPKLTDEEIKSAVDFMVSQAK